MKLRKPERMAPSGKPPRDQLESAFAGILLPLLARVRGARAAALVDADGETVDYVGRADPFFVRVAAAHWRIVLKGAQGKAGLGDLVSIAVRLARASYVVHALPSGYAIVLLLRQHAQLGGHRRAISACARLLAEEAGWPASPQFQWNAVDVVKGPGGRPQGLRVVGRTEPIDVLGSYNTGLDWRERGWRVRLTSGAEAMLVRERSGFWYTDEVLAPGPSKKAPSPPGRGTQATNSSATKAAILRRLRLGSGPRRQP